MATITENVLRVLRAYNIEDSIVIERVKEDRVFAKPTDGRLTELITAGLESGTWNRTSVKVANRLHGGGVIASYREQASPSMQVTLHADGVLEIDLDQHDPEMDLVSFFGHAAECIANKCNGQKTDQDDMEHRLDRRFKA